MARDLGRFVSGAQNTVEEFKEELLSEDVKEARHTVGEFKSELTAPFQEIKDGVRQSADELKAQAAESEQGDEPTVELSSDEVVDGEYSPKDRRNPLGKEEVPPSKVRVRRK